MPSPEGGYLCSCGSCYPLSSLYYCQRCKTVRCRFCIHESIQCYYCPSCEQNVPSGEAMETENQCKKCFECPCCQTTLKMSAKLSNVSGENKTVVYFQCSFCCWTSLDILTASSPEELLNLYSEQNSNQKQESDFKELVESLKKTEHDLKMKQRKYRKRSLYRSSSSNLSRIFVPGDPSQNLATSLKDKEEALTFTGKQKKIADNAPPFPSLGQQVSFDTTDVKDISSLEQRFANFPYSNKVNTKDLLPNRKILSSKCTKACSSCDKVLVKPGMNPSQVQFDLRHVAWLFLPRFRLASENPKSFVKDKEYQLLLTVQHQVQDFMYFKLKRESTRGNAEILLFGNDSNDDEEPFQYILPFEFDPDVDIELQEQLEKLKSQKDPNWIIGRNDNSINLSIPFIPKGTSGNSLEIAFEVYTKFTLPTGQQETSFTVLFTIGEIIEQ